MPRIGFEPTIAVLERVKTFALDHTDNMMGCIYPILHYTTSQ
jgi:hypothetical protein